MQFLFLLFILVPIVEIMVFIQVGDIIGLGSTLVMVVLTAIIGVNLLKQQGLKTWSNIQQKLAQGQVPALEVASAAQLLFAGGLLLTPGFVTDFIGFSLMLPYVRNFVANQAIKRWQVKAQTFNQSQQSPFSGQQHNFNTSQQYGADNFSHASDDTNRHANNRDNRDSSRTNKRANKLADKPNRVIEGEFEENDDSTSQ